MLLSPRTAAVDQAASADRPALVVRTRTITYAELGERVEEVRRELGPTRRLLLLEAGNTPATIVAYLAALRGRHPTMLVPPGDSLLGQRLLEEYDPDVVLAAPSVESDLPILTEVRPGTRHELHPHLALLLGTSGSTGSPRLVRLSRRNLSANARAIGSYLDLGHTDVAITSLPMHYCYGLSVLNSHLRTGASVVLSQASVVDPCFWRAVADHRVTNIAGVPHTFELLDRAGFESMDVPSLRFLTQAGGKLDPGTVRRYAELGRQRGWDLFVMYGQTEATARMAYLPPERAATHSHAIGVPIPRGHLRLDDTDGSGVGELVYSGPNVMLGYADGPADLGQGRTTHELRTGDLARRGPEGLFEIVGRRSRFLKLFGLRIDLDAAEQLVASTSAGARCTGDDAGLVVAVPTGGDAAAVTTTLTEALGLPRSAISVVAVEAPPLLPSGKVDYRTILDLRPVPVAVRGGTDVRTLYAELLDVPVADVDDDATFVSLGGDSLTYVEMSMRLETLLGDLPPNWHHTPVGELVPSPRRGGWRVLETSVVLRALAILAVVVSHASAVDVVGGAHLLLTVTGFNFARFQLGALRASGATANLWRSISRVAAPSVAGVAVTQLLAGALFVPQLLLVVNLVGAPTRRGLWRFWYLEVLVLLLVGLALLFRSRWMQAVERRDPARFAWAVLAVALLVRFDVVPLPDGAYPRFQVHNVLWLFALGWVAERCVTRSQRAAVSAVAAVALVGWFTTPTTGLLVFAGFLVLVWRPTLGIPRPLNRAVGGVAGASLFIYLTHWHVLGRLDAPPEVVVPVALLVGVAVAMAYDRVAGISGLRPRARARMPGSSDRVTPRGRQAA